MIRSGRRVALDQVQRIAVEIARAIEPGLLVEIDDVDDEGVAFPVATRIAHPPVDMTLGMFFVHVRVANRVDVLVKKGHLIPALHDLKRVRHVRDARNAGQVTLGFGVGRLAVLVVLLLLQQRRGRVRDFVALNHTFASGNTKPRAVVLNIPCGGVDDLPDALDVRLAVGGFRRRIPRESCGRSLARLDLWRGEEDERRDRRGNHEPDEPVCHP